MSEKTEESRAPSLSVDSALDALEHWYHVPALGAVLAFMLWVRVQAWENFTQNGEVYFSGNDAYYHFRQVTYTVQNWPETMPFDPWTGFPTGNFAGQFGTLFDQLVATAALVIGLGDPSTNTVAMTLLFAPAVFGALLAIPTYFIGKRLGGRIGGVFAAVILALLPGYFLQRSLVGAADHNGAEPLFMSLAVLGTMVALSLAEREKPVYEQFVDRDVAGLRSVVGWSVVAGVATAAYMWMWPPGVLLVGIFGAFYLVKLASDYYSNTSPDHVAIVGAVSMATTGVLMLLAIEQSGFGVSGFTILQPAFSFAVAFGCVFLAWFARVWDDYEYSDTGYVVSVFAILLVGIGVLTFIAPSFWSTIQTNLLRFLGFSSGAATRTIGEAQPFLSRTGRYGLGLFGVVFLEYGLAFFTAMLAAGWILLRPHFTSGNLKRFAGAAVAVVVAAIVHMWPSVPSFIGGLVGLDSVLAALGIVIVALAAVIVTGDYDGEELLVVVWGAFITSAAFTQVRFNYYLVVPVVVLNAYMLKVVLAGLSLDKPASQVQDINWYQVGTIVMVVLLVLVPIAAPVVADATDNESARGSSSPITLTNEQNQRVPLQSVTEVGKRNGPGAVTIWDDALTWMKQNTPEQGNYGGAGNADQLKYYGTYDRTDDFDYPEGSYGVMSWWDYGHWITTQSQRVPNANPFQQGATNAANYLLAPNETRAQQVLDARAGPGEETRYVMVDYQMASVTSKFSAPVTFYDDENVSYSDFAAQVYSLQETERGTFVDRSSQVYEQRYYDSLMMRLYRYHGSAQQAQPIVVDWETRELTASDGSTVEVRTVGDNESMVKRFPNMSAAEAYVEEDGSAQIGGVGPFPSEDVPALEHYRLVKASEAQNRNFQLNDRRQAAMAGDQLYGLIYQSSATSPNWVKTFEKVPGATVEGSGAPANTEVTASVEMRMPSSNETFVYTQHAQTNEDGEFTLTLPYSTTGYDEFGPENGYTNVSVRANTSYTVTTPSTTNESGYTIQYGQQFNVSEEQVLGVDEEPTQITLEKRTQAPEGAQNDSDTGGNDTNTSSLTAPDSFSMDSTDTGSVDAPSTLSADALGPAARVTN